MVSIQASPSLSHSHPAGSLLPLAANRNYKHPLRLSASCYDIHSPLTVGKISYPDTRTGDAGRCCFRSDNKFFGITFLGVFHNSSCTSNVIRHCRNLWQTLRMNQEFRFWMSCPGFFHISCRHSQVGRTSTVNKFEGLLRHLLLHHAPRLQSGINRILSLSIFFTIFTAEEEVTHTSQIVFNSEVVLI
mgnify:CR=1 FL=1